MQRATVVSPSRESPLTLPPEFAAARDRYDDVYVIVSPPRCSSTAFARLLWQQPTVRYYSHEPFEVLYFDGAVMGDVVAKLERPLDLATFQRDQQTGTALVVKEMPYQVGVDFPLLAATATGPLTFLLRDPRQNVASRMEMKEEVGDSPIFPLNETGWQLLEEQVEYCRDRGIPFLIVDTNELRNHPELMCPKVVGTLGLPWDDTMLEWQALPQLDIDNLGGRHRHLYRRVLASRGLDPAYEPIPDLDFFPEEGGFRDHVEFCLDVYRRLLDSEERISTA